MSQIELKKSAAFKGAIHARGSSGIMARLRHAILSGVYVEGDKLPPERDLSMSFSAARSTVRRALERLETEGMVNRRIGSGTFVTYTGPVQGETGEIADLISPLQLIEARFAVEPYMTRLAAVHATQRDLELMGEVLQRLCQVGDDKDAFTTIDMEFHLSIARCSRNPLLLHVYQEINNVRSRALWNSTKEKVLSVQQIDAYNEQHQKIYEELKHRDAASASEQIKAHLEKARSDLIGAESS